MSKTKNIVLVGAFLAIIYGTGLSQMALEMSRGERPGFAELFTRKPTESNLRAFEKNLEDSNWLSKHVRPLMQFVQFMVYNDAGDKALRGKQNWFFYKPGVDYITQRWPDNPKSGCGRNDIICAIKSFNDQLAQRGIKLLVIPAPNKESVYPEKLSARATNLDQPVNIYTRQTLAKLKENGIEIVDLFETFSKTNSQSSAANYYLAQDSHWSPFGMELAAKIVAERLVQLGWIQKGTADYNASPITVSRYGDVLRMIQVPLIEQQFVPEQIGCTQIIGPENSQTYKDNPKSEVLVLGDSFLRIYEKDEPKSSGFIAHLAKELKFPLASIVSDGGASTLVRQQLSRKPEMLNNKKVVIWEFTERDIRFGTEGWQDIKLPPLPSLAAGQ